MFDPLRNDSRFQKLVAPDSIQKGSAVPAQIPEKSIAVLPFENLSRDPDNGFFTDGVQDEILTDLARVADLKVISRTSVMQYKTEANHNLRQIGKELGVAQLRTVETDAILGPLRGDPRFEKIVASIASDEGPLKRRTAEVLKRKKSRET